MNIGNNYQRQEKLLPYLATETNPFAGKLVGEDVLRDFEVVKPVECEADQSFL